MNKKLFLLLTTLVFSLFLCSTATAASVANTTKTNSVEKTTTVVPPKTVDIGPDIVYTAENPDVDGDIVVYEYKDFDYYGGFSNSYIYYKNLTSKSGGKVSSYAGWDIQQIKPKVSGTRVVWVDNREGKNAIYWKDLATGGGGRVSSYYGPNLNQDHPDISVSRVVWKDYREGAWAIYWKNIATGTGGRVSSYYPPAELYPYPMGNLRQESPAISGTRVVWTDWREKESQDPYSYFVPVIYWKDLTSTASDKRVSSYIGDGDIFTNDLEQVTPDIRGTRVVWSDKREGKNVIYWKDLSSNAGGRVSSYTGPNLDQCDPAISGTRIVWQDNREGKPVIYWKDISNGSGGRVSSYYGKNLHQFSPAISGTRVVWQDGRELATLNEGGTVTRWNVYWKNVIGVTGGKIL